MERHEFTHDAAARRKRFDTLHVLAVLCVVGLLAFQAVVLTRVFQQHRSRRMRVEASDLVTATTPASNESPTNALPATTNAPVGATTNEAKAMPAPVLNPAVKVQQAQRRDEARAVNLQLRVRAQSGESRFDPKQAAVCVQWQTASGAVQEQWLAVPVRWENFSVETLTARFAGAPGQLRGWTVRTFYRGQLQETMTSKPVS